MSFFIYTLYSRVPIETQETTSYLPKSILLNISIDDHDHAEAFQNFVTLRHIISNEVKYVTLYQSSQVSSKFGVYKFLVFSEILVHSFNSPILDCTNRECQPC
jgi:hypothetical protein